MHASSRHLSHDFVAYKGLTLRELLLIVIVTTISTCFLLMFIGFLMGWPLAMGCFGVVLGFIVAITLAPKPLARLKAGKPHGYLLKVMRLKLARLGVMKSPYLKHQGLWQKSKRFGGRNV